MRDEEGRGENEREWGEGWDERQWGGEVWGRGWRGRRRGEEHIEGKRKTKKGEKK